MDALWGRVSRAAMSWLERREMRLRLSATAKKLSEAKTDEEKRAVVVDVYRHVTK